MSCKKVPTVIIRSDPAESPRVTEALRVAIGVSGGEADKVKLILMEHAPRILFEDPLDFEDGEDMEQHLDAILEYEMLFYVEDSFFHNNNNLPGSDFDIQTISSDTLGEYIADSCQVLIF